MPIFYSRVSFWGNDVKSELTALVDATQDSKNLPEPAPARTRRGKRRTTQETTSGGAVRFFLSKSENNSIPVLDREFAAESEAIIESLKTGKSYFVISEWKGLADVSKKMPLIRKEAVTSKKQSIE
jgi:hypothetical protein